jgi:hypothetical protein
MHFTKLGAVKKFEKKKHARMHFIDDAQGIQS